MVRMAERLAVALVVAVCGVAACGGGPAAVGDDGAGELSGHWDGLPWHGRGYAVVSNDSIRLHGYRRPAGMDVVVPATGPGEYVVPMGSATHWQIVGGDAKASFDAGGTVVLETSGERVRGSLELESERTARGTVWRFMGGSFDLPVYGSADEAPCLDCGSP